MRLQSVQCPVLGPWGDTSLGDSSPERKGAHERKRRGSEKQANEQVRGGSVCSRAVHEHWEWLQQACQTVPWGAAREQRANQSSTVSKALCVLTQETMRQGADTGASPDQ